VVDVGDDGDIAEVRAGGSHPETLRGPLLSSDFVPCLVTSPRGLS
jgi:hypothetical protein